MVEVKTSDCSSIKLASVLCDTAVSFTPECATMRTGRFSAFNPSAESTRALRTNRCGFLRNFSTWSPRACVCSPHEFLHFDDHVTSRVIC